jgi:hypothetical protein
MYLGAEWLVTYSASVSTLAVMDSQVSIEKTLRNEGYVTVGTCYWFRALVGSQVSFEAGKPFKCLVTIFTLELLISLGMTFCMF